MSLTGSIFLLPEVTPDEGIYVIDTSEMFSALEGETSERRAFGKMCNLLRIRIPTDCLHNAGNDAHVRSHNRSSQLPATLMIISKQYTMLAMKAMASGSQLDLQREERWPNKVSESAKIQFDSWDEDSEFSDEEMMIPYASRVYVGGEENDSMS